MRASTPSVLRRQLGCLQFLREFVPGEHGPWRPRDARIAQHPAPLIEPILQVADAALLAWMLCVADSA
jgi:hypothetical protein